MRDTLLGLPTDPHQRIEQLYVWVVIHANGGEGIASVGSLPLMTSKHHLAVDLMLKAAERILQMSKDLPNPGVRVELRAFTWLEPKTFN